MVKSNQAHLTFQAVDVDAVEDEEVVVAVEIVAEVIDVIGVIAVIEVCLVLSSHEVPTYF